MVNLCVFASFICLFWPEKSVIQKALFYLQTQLKNSMSKYNILEFYSFLSCRLDQRDWMPPDELEAIDIRAKNCTGTCLKTWRKFWHGLVGSNHELILCTLSCGKSQMRDVNVSRIFVK